jgi:hypothetical protein
LEFVEATTKSWKKETGLCQTIKKAVKYLCPGSPRSPSFSSGQNNAQLGKIMLGWLFEQPESK